MKHIAALLSGGVDSSVALAKYIEWYPERKSNITAFYLKIWLEDELAFLGDCPWQEDIYYAQKVADQIDIELKIIPLQREYYDNIVTYAIEELKAGGTPSPDIFCNERIKFGTFLERVQDVDTVISGHYAISTSSQDASVHLYQAKDPVKDQTYFLSHLSSEQLRRTAFPIGPLMKKEVRTYALSSHLATAHRKDSQGICFLGKIKYTDFVKHYLGTKKGNIVDKETHAILGTHNGVWFYTIGQRSGLGLSNGPWFVIDKSLEDNTVWVQHGTLLSKEEISDILVTQLYWIHPPHADNTHPTVSDNLRVKIRHGKDMIPASLEYTEDNEYAIVHLERGEVGVAPGQYIVLYRDKECLGCARISSPIRK